MLPLQSLFGKSPFTPLIRHMESVRSCVRELVPLVKAFQENHFTHIETLSLSISQKEHAADTIKNDIRNSLTGSLFLSIDKTFFLNMLEAQDDIADTIEDVAVIMSLRSLTFLQDIEPLFSQFVQKNLDAFESVFDMVQELPGLNEVSFIGIEAEKVKLMAGSVARKEHEADLIQRELMKKLLKHDTNLTPGMFHQWQKILEAIGAVSDASERLSLAIRDTVDTSGS